MRNGFGLAELMELEAELPKIKKGDVRTIKLILKIVQMPNNLVAEARETLSGARQKIAELNGRVRRLDKEMTEASDRIGVEEKQIKSLERVVAKFA